MGDPRDDFNIAFSRQIQISRSIFSLQHRCWKEPTLHLIYAFINTFIKIYSARLGNRLDLKWMRDA